MGHRVKGYWADGDWPCLEAPWSSDPLFSLAPHDQLGVQFFLRRYGAAGGDSQQRYFLSTIGP